MHNGIVIVVILLIIFLYYQYYYKYSYFNTTKTILCNGKTCEKYNVHKEHTDHEEAAKLMQEITRRIDLLISHLRNKYLNNHFQPSVDPMKNGRIDIIPGSDAYTTGFTADSLFEINTDKLDNIKEIMRNEYVQERIRQLISKYDKDNIYEISPLNSSGLTSYTQDKKTLIFCLRKKEKNASGENELHDINILMFVVIHEISHMAGNQWGHPVSFWVLFKFLLENAVECNIYKAINYGLYPVNYCGLKLEWNPLFDKSV